MFSTKTCKKIISKSTSSWLVTVIEMFYWNTIYNANIRNFNSILTLQTYCAILLNITEYFWLLPDREVVVQLHELKWTIGNYRRYYKFAATLLTLPIIVIRSLFVILSWLGDCTETFRSLSQAVTMSTTHGGGLTMLFSTLNTEQGRHEYRFLILWFDMTRNGIRINLPMAWPKQKADGEGTWITWNTLDLKCGGSN